MKLQWNQPKKFRTPWNKSKINIKEKKVERENQIRPP